VGLASFSFLFPGDAPPDEDADAAPVPGVSLQFCIDPAATGMEVASRAYSPPRPDCMRCHHRECWLPNNTRC
jgi:hypothetical protein